MVMQSCRSELFTDLAPGYTQFKERLGLTLLISQQCARFQNSHCTRSR